MAHLLQFRSSEQVAAISTGEDNSCKKGKVTLWKTNLTQIKISHYKHKSNVVYVHEMQQYYKNYEKNDKIYLEYHRKMDF